MSTFTVTGGMQDETWRQLLATAAALGAATAAIAEQPQTVKYILKNVAATDAAQALTRFAEQKTLSIHIVADPISNTLMLSARSTSLQQVLKVLCAMMTNNRRATVQIGNAQSGVAANITPRVSPDGTIAAAWSPSSKRSPDKSPLLKPLKPPRRSATVTHWSYGGWTRRMWAVTLRY